MSYKTLASTYISEHKYFTAREDKYETEAGKIVDQYFVVELPVSACAMAITEENEVVLVKQFRYPVKEMLIELPGGFVEDGEQSHQGIERELMEETGYTFDSFHYLGMTTANPGVLSNYTHLYIALGGKKTNEQALDNNEEIEILLKPLSEVKIMLEHHEIKQSMHALCLFYGFEFLKKHNIAEELI